MTRTVLTAAVFAASLAAPAFAGGNLAASLGVDAGSYTTAQLVQLKAAKADDDHSRIRQIMAEVEAGGFDGASRLEQIAGGIDADGLSAADTVTLKAAIDEDDAQRIFALRGTGTTVSDTTFSSRGSSVSEQLSASVGVAPGSLSNAQLVQLKAAQAEDDHNTIFRIRAAAN